MANTIDWGKIYCYMTEWQGWGNYENTKTIDIPSAPDCFATSVDCGQASSFSGGEAFPTVINVNLGDSTGTVTLDFQAYTVPDKFEVWFDGNKVIDTGYRGSTNQQATLDNALAARGLPSETITSPGAGSASFQKTTSSNIAQVRIYAPISNTAWDVEMNCPV
ncbi:MAG: hypothetical protein EBY39_03140 [Flavobacteriia bacterium]|nr:hypothetical protein [Flavobacteriia bacterium]